MIYLHWLVLAVYMVVIITTMVAVIMDDRQPEKTLGWLLVLWFMPVVGILLYIFFGQNIRRQHLMSKRSMDQLTKRSMLEFAEQKGLAIPDIRAAGTAVYQPGHGPAVQGQHGRDIHVGV